MSKEGLHVTHALRINHKENGISREMRMFQISDGTYGIEIETRWPDEDQPVLHRFRLTPIALEMLTFLLSIVDELPEHPVPKERS